MKWFTLFLIFKQENCHIVHGPISYQLFTQYKQCQKFFFCKQGEIEN